MLKSQTIFVGALLAVSVMLVSCKKEPVVKEADGVYNGHEYVDLGLPSGLKWATCNIGATKPEDRGGYYQWGATKDVSNTLIYLDWDNCPFHSGTDMETGWIKYINSVRASYWSGTGEPDNIKVLDPLDDVAQVEWEGTWRMPTQEDWAELMNGDNCSWWWSTINGVDGMKVVSLREGYEGSWIFLPAAGTRKKGDHTDFGNVGYYWSSSLLKSEPQYACGAYFHSTNYDPCAAQRYAGNSVRAVSK